MTRRGAAGLVGSLAASLALLAAVAGCDQDPERSPNAESPDAEFRQQAGLIVFHEPREIVVPPLVDQHGGTFGVDALRNKWSFVFFGYAACPDICPVTMATLRDAERTLADGRFQAVLVSVDPQRDAPEALRAYLEVFSPRFLGVTGTVDRLREFGLELAAGFTRGDPPEDAPDRYLVDHSGHAAIIDPEGRFAAILKNPRRTENVVAAFRSLAGRRGPSSAPS